MRRNAGMLNNGNGPHHRNGHHPHGSRMIMMHDLSQGSYDTIPATPDSLIASSLHCSTEEDPDSASAHSSTSQLHHHRLLQQQHQQQQHLTFHPPLPPAQPTNAAQILLNPPPSTSPLITPSPSPSPLLQPQTLLASKPPASATNECPSLRSSTSNLSVQQQRDNLIEEVMTPVPTALQNQFDGKLLRPIKRLLKSTYCAARRRNNDIGRVAGFNVGHIICSIGSLITHEFTLLRARYGHAYETAIELAVCAEAKPNNFESRIIGH